MNKRKLDSLLWENIPIDNFIVSGHSDIKQENLDDVFWDDVDELCVNRDDNYNISISCVRYLNNIKKKSKDLQWINENYTWGDYAGGKIRNKNI